MKKSQTRVPKGLGDRGRRLWKATMNAGTRADEHDRQLIETACRLADRIDQCREILARDGLTSRGRYGQLVQHPLVEVERSAMAEFRQCLKLSGLSRQIPQEEFR